MRQRPLICLGFLSVAILFAACGKQEEAAAPDAVAAAGSADSAAAGSATAAAATPGSWTAEALEKLLATRRTLPGQTRQAGYAGARPENRAARERMVAKSPPPGVARDLPTRPKTEYKGATNRPTGAGRAADAKRPSGANRPPGPREQPQHRPSGTADRGRDSSTATRPSAGRQGPPNTA
jgi:hypothetical protein